MTQVDKLSAEELEVVLQERTKPLIIDFYATWCGPCLLLAKELEQASIQSQNPARQSPLPHRIFGSDLAVSQRG